jgi:hypothetical protein
MQAEKRWPSGAALLAFLFAAADLCSKPRVWRHFGKFSEFLVAEIKDLSINK